MTQFNDEATISSWAVGAVHKVADLGLMRGDDQGNFNPKAPITREEFATVLARVITESTELDDEATKTLLRSVADTVIQVNNKPVLGSGVVIAPGYALTNAHVVGDSTEVEVVFTSVYRTGSEPGFVGPMCSVVAVDKDNDLALIAIPDDMTPGKAQVNQAWADDDKANKTFFGDRLMVQGSPVGFGGRISEVFFDGIRILAGKTYLDLGGAVNPGNSGGPVFDANGCLAGLVVAKLVDVEFEGLGLGIPLSRILPFLAAHNVTPEAFHG